jgi:hypothetical protein
MRSSTSNFEIPKVSFKAAILWILALIIIFCLGAEIGTRYGFSRFSRIQNRIHTEKAAFMRLRPETIDTPRNVVFVGNSLLLFSVDVPLLNKLGSGWFNYSRLVLEQTQYVDWLFGLQRLLHEGSRPDTVVLVFGANHWLADTVRAEYFAYELMQPFDIFSVAREINLDRTVASNYFFASFSAWLGGRAEIRKFLLSNVIPDLEQFVRTLNDGPPLYPADSVVFDKARTRMTRMKALCESYGVQLVTVLHPTNQVKDPFDVLTQAANASALPMVIPVAKMTYPRKLYSDGYHLNMLGMDRFTRDLLSPLEDVLRGNEGRFPPRSTSTTLQAP